MTLRERVEATPVDELPRLAAEIAEAQALLIRRIATTAAPIPTDDLTMEEVAAELKVHVKTAYRWTRRAYNPIPTVGYGAARRVNRTAFAAWRQREAELNRER